MTNIYYGPKLLNLLSHNSKCANMLLNIKLLNIPKNHISYRERSYAIECVKIYGTKKEKEYFNTCCDGKKFTLYDLININYHTSIKINVEDKLLALLSEGKYEDLILCISLKQDKDGKSYLIENMEEELLDEESDEKLNEKDIEFLNKETEKMENILSDTEVAELVLRASILKYCKEDESDSEEEEEYLSNKELKTLLQQHINNNN